MVLNVDLEVEGGDSNKFAKVNKEWEEETKESQQGTQNDKETFEQLSCDTMYEKNTSHTCTGGAVILFKMCAMNRTALIE